MQCTIQGCLRRRSGTGHFFANLIEKKHRSCSTMNTEQLIQQQVQQLQSQLNSLQARLESANTVEEDEDMESEQPEASWNSVVRPATMVPTSTDALTFIKLLSTPPPLMDLKRSEGDIVLYSGVPETPAQRRNKVDAQLQPCHGDVFAHPPSGNWGQRSTGESSSLDKISLTRHQ